WGSTGRSVRFTSGSYVPIGLIRVAGAVGGVGDQPTERPTHLLYLGLRDARPDLGVEGARRPSKALGERPTRRRELYLLDAPVLGWTEATDQAGLLHGVQVMRERGALDAHPLGDLALRGGRPGPQRKQDEPDGARPALARQHRVELAVQDLDGVPEGPADGWSSPRCGHAGVYPGLISALTI